MTGIEGEEVPLTRGKTISVSSTGVVHTGDVNVALNDDGEEFTVNQYHIGKTLGSGAFGTVVICYHETDHKQFAMKCLSRSFLKRRRDFVKENGRVTIKTAFDDVQTEIAVMKKIVHPNTVKLMEVIDDENNDKLYMVMEFVHGGQIMTWNAEDLKYYDNNGDLLEESVARLRIRDVVLGLNYLHRQKIVHRDLKPENLLLNDKDTVKIADFGVSHISGDTEASKAKLNKMKGTHFFVAPEATDGKEYDGFAADVWALGCNLYAFVFGSLPFYDDDIEVLFENIKSNPLEFPDDARSISTELKDLLEKMLEKDPSKRITLNEILDHPWISPPGMVPLSQASNPVDVIITDAEIEAAITPADLNFFQVAKLKTVFAKKIKNAKGKVAEKELKEKNEIKKIISNRTTKAPEMVVTKEVESEQPVSNSADANPISSDSKNCCVIS